MALYRTDIQRPLLERLVHDPVFYSPLPSFFDKSWRAGEVELVK
jgi:hypothetical protein